MPRAFFSTFMAVSSDPATADDTSSLTEYPWMSIMSQLLSENSSSLRLTNATPTDLAYAIIARMSSSLRGSAGISIPTGMRTASTTSFSFVSAMRDHCSSLGWSLSSSNPASARTFAFSGSMVAVYRWMWWSGPNLSFRRRMQ